MTFPMVSVEDLSKAYRVGSRETRPDTIGGAALSLLNRPFRNFKNLVGLNTFDEVGRGKSGNNQLTVATRAKDVHWALSEISFEVNEGEVVGIIGHNGAGKSTLLKILSRITQPTLGRAVIKGRLSSLLEVGTGFHPELSGRENVYMNGTILGMRKSEIDKAFDEIVDFSGVEQFLDTPVKRYSSGMKVRLAFSVAAHLQPEVLVVDEVLAVGDQEFQDKCLRKMEDVAGYGRTVLFVSHNMAAVSAMCDRTLVLKNGSVSFDGNSEEGIRRYLNAGETGTASYSDPMAERRDSPVIYTAEVLDDEGEVREAFRMGEGLTVRFSIGRFEAPMSILAGVGITNGRGVKICGYNSADVHGVFFNTGETVTIECRFPKLNLFPGNYSLTIHCKSKDRILLDRLDRELGFKVVASDYYPGGRLPKGQDLVFYDVEWAEVGCPK